MFHRGCGSIVTVQSPPCMATTICPSEAPSATGCVDPPPGARTVTLIESCGAVEPTVVGETSVPAVSRRMIRQAGPPAWAIASVARPLSPACARPAARGANPRHVTRDLAHDPLRAGLDDHDFFLGREVVITAVLRLDRDDGGRQPFNPHVPRDSLAHSDRDVEIALWRRQALAGQRLGNAHLLVGRDPRLLAPLRLAGLGLCARGFSSRCPGRSLLCPAASFEVSSTRSRPDFFWVVDIPSRSFWEVVVPSLDFSDSALDFSPAALSRFISASLLALSLPLFSSSLPGCDPVRARPALRPHRRRRLLSSLAAVGRSLDGAALPLSSACREPVPRSSRPIAP